MAPVIALSVLSVVPVALCILSKCRIDHPIILFNGLWAILLFFLSINILGYDQINTQVFLVVFIMLIAFPAGAYIGTRVAFNARQGFNRQMSHGFHFRKYFFGGLCSVAIIVMLVDQSQILISLLRGASFQSIMRGAGGKDTVDISGAQVLFYVFFVYPVQWIVSPVCAMFFMSGHSNRFRYLVLNIIVTFLSVAHHGGRISIFLFAISYVICFIIYNKQIYVSKKSKFFYIACLGCLIFLIYVVSVSRGIENVGKSFYAYFTCSIPLLQHFLEMPIITQAHTYGSLSLNGFIYPVMLFLGYFGIQSPSWYIDATNIRFYLEDNYLYLGNYDHGLNVFIPYGGFPYIDGGYMFELFFMSFLGFIVGYCYKCMVAQHDPFHTVLYVLLINSLLLSFIRLHFSTYAFAIAFCYIFIMFRNNQPILPKYIFKRERHDFR